MQGAIIILAATILLAAILWITDKKPTGRNTQTADTIPAEEPETCCGQHQNCTKFNTLPPTEDLYYDDEELDALAGIDPRQLTDTQVEQLRDIMLSLKPHEINPWIQALQTRKIQLPEILRDEAIILLQDQ